MIILCLFTFSNVFASSQYSYSDKIRSGIRGISDYLIITRNNGSSDPAIAAKRKKGEDLLKKVLIIITIEIKL